jgi:hypothetical protein
METQVSVEGILKSMREIIGTQAQEIAVLKATVEVLEGLMKPSDTTQP